MKFAVPQPAIRICMKPGRFARRGAHAADNSRMKIAFPLACLILAAIAHAAPPASDPASPARAFAPRSMAYVLQAEGLAGCREGVVQELAGCERDLVVLDAAFSIAGGAWTPAEIETIRDGRPGRRVLAYVSIGEAEDYRPYWQKHWDADGDGQPDATAPAFLHSENPAWKGNCRVRYWQPAWQQIMLPAVDRVVAQGFDGIYLDIVDAFEFYEHDAAKNVWRDHLPNPETGRTYRQGMIAWVDAIARRARAVRPDFLVVPQNAAQLLENPSYRALISGIGVEDLFIAENELRSASDAAYTIGFLEKLKPLGKPVLVIDYPASRSLNAGAFERARQHGFALLLTDRPLTTLGTATPPVR